MCPNLDVQYVRGLGAVSCPVRIYCQSTFELLVHVKLFEQAEHQVVL
jgi:hypothetical protein